MSALGPQSCGNAGRPCIERSQREFAAQFNVYATQLPGSQRYGVESNVRADMEVRPYGSLSI